MQALVSENAITASMYACSATYAYLYPVHLLSLLNASNTLTQLCQVHPSAHLYLTHQLCLLTLTRHNQHICSPLPNRSTMSAYLPTLTWYTCSPLPNTSTMSAHLDPEHPVHLLSLLNTSNTLTHLCQVYPSAHLCLTHQVCLPIMTWYNQHTCSPLPNTSTMSAHLDPVHLLTFT